MHFALSLFLLSFVVLQQIINVESLVSPIQSADNEAGRPNVARRLRAPLMGRSLLSMPPINYDDVDLMNNDSGSSSVSEDDDLVFLNKRRPSMPLFGRRWIPTKRRGPLFG